MAKRSKSEIAAEIAALQAQLDAQDGGVYEDPATGRWFIVVRPPGREKTTTRRRAPDGSQLLTREQALIAKGLWEDRMQRGAVAIGRERFEQFWPRYLRHAKGEMTQGSWEDVRAHGTKRLLPFFTGADRRGERARVACRDARGRRGRRMGAQDRRQRPDRAARLPADGRRGRPDGLTYFGVAGQRARSTSDHR